MDHEKHEIDERDFISNCEIQRLTVFAGGRWAIVISFFRVFRGLLLLLIAVLCAGGCGKAGPKRYHLSGKVTWGGKPIPAGMIYIEPDLAAGTNGLQAYAIIQNGQYDTRNGGQGHSGGKSVLRVFAGDGIASGEATMGKALFPEYSWNEELPTENAVKDFVIPADVKKRLGM